MKGACVPTAQQPMQLDPRAYARGLACVHCGLCLPACPTYVETGNEADSPRGRIQLMLGLADGRIGLTPSVKHHLDLCLGCRGCETACPSGVIYHELIEDARPRILRHARSDPDERILRWIFLNVLTHPARLKLAMLPARLLQKLGIFRLLQQVGAFRLLPAKFEKLVQMLPEAGPLWSRSLRGGNLSPRLIERRERSEHPESVAFFEGCIGSVIFEQVNRQSIELLSACGAKVSVPEQQACCGAIHHHNGDHHGALERARRNIDAFADAGLIVTNVAGCGAMLREYDLLLRDDPRYADRARQFASRVRDISEALLELGLPEPRRELKQTATYHDACHLAHAQHVTSAPRELLARIPGLKLVPLPECDMCCGAAGTYNLQHPEMATRLAERKLDNIAITGAEICVTGNVGCAMHLQSQANAREQTLRVVHPVELLHQAVLGERE